MPNDSSKPSLNNEKIRQILLEGAYVNEEDLVKAEKFVQTNGGSLVEYLLAEEIITRDLFGQAVAESLNVPYADLNSHEPPVEEILKIPEVLAKQYRMIVFENTPESVTVSTDTPGNAEIPKILKEIFPTKKIVIAYSLEEDIDEHFVHYRKPLETRFSKIIKKQKRIAPEIIHEILEDAL